MYQFFNMTFASVPILIYAVFDREYSDETLLKYPHFYMDGPNNIHFYSGKYWSWFWVAFLNGLIVLASTFFTFGNEAVNDSGWTSHFWVTGNAVLQAVVYVVNFKILIFSTQYSILLVASVIASILCFYLVHYIFNLFVSNELFGSFLVYHFDSYSP